MSTHRSEASRGASHRLFPELLLTSVWALSGGSALLIAKLADARWKK